MLSESEVARDIYKVEEGRPSGRNKTLEKLSLEKIVKNRVPSPCTLPEFMDYLVYEEKNAQILQFFTWFCGYVSRWTELSPQAMLLSPPWKSAPQDGRSGTALTVQSHRRKGSDRLEQILRILDTSHATDALNKITDQGHKRVNSETLNFSGPRTLSGAGTLQMAKIAQSPSSTVLAAPTDAEQEAMYLQQPHREEITQIMQHYIRADAPRRLRIPGEDLANCLDAVRYTTHPSALLRAFTACESRLRASSHPSFIRQSQRNANKPRLILVRLLACLGVLLGFILSLVLILSRCPAFYRVFSISLWWPSFTALIASFRGICLFLYSRGLRQLRPWEQPHNSGGSNYAEALDDNDHGFSISEVRTHIFSTPRDAERDPSSVRSPNSQTDSSLRSVCINVDVCSSNSTTSTSARMDPETMQAFGGPNKLECEARWIGYLGKPIVRRIWDDRVRLQSSTVRLLQGRTVLVSVCSAGAVSSILTVASLWVPAGSAV